MLITRIIIISTNNRQSLFPVTAGEEETHSSDSEWARHLKRSRTEKP